MGAFLVLLSLIAIKVSSTLDAYQSCELRISSVNVDEVVFPTLAKESIRSESFMKCVLICKAQDVFYAIFCPIQHICMCRILKVWSVEATPKTRKLQISKIKGKCLKNVYTKLFKTN